EIARSFAPEQVEDCDLNVLRSFKSEQDWVLQPGDVLYLPPGIAHHGVALDAGMTWSVGMRAPSTADVFQALGEWLAEARGEGARYRDPDLAPAAAAGHIAPDALERFRDLASTLLNDTAEWSEFLGSFLSRYRLAHEPAPPPGPTGKDALRRALQRGQRLAPNPWTRLLWLEGADGAILFAAGSAYRCSASFAAQVCDPALLRGLGPDLDSGAIDLLHRLVNQGHLYLEPL
ncbi:MAG: AraC family ligand binding domain-containing protein, partial [Planctomycetes bacterium]|nr:AraC family ligand binding domain-containing protein [Planctomycetota bacterium]